MSEREIFFIGLDPDKETGICEPDGGSWDNGTVVEIKKDCVICRQGKCMMFEEVDDQETKKTAKKFTSHLPEY